MTVQMFFFFTIIKTIKPYNVSYAYTLATLIVKQGYSSLKIYDFIASKQTTFIIKYWHLFLV